MWIRYGGRGLLHMESGIRFEALVTNKNGYTSAVLRQSNVSTGKTVAETILMERLLSEEQAKNLHSLLVAYTDELCEALKSGQGLCDMSGFSFDLE